MSIVIFLILLLPVIYKTVKVKNGYLYLFCVLYPILPDTFAIELSSKLPLLTGARILLLIMLVLSIWKYSDEIEVNAMLFYPFIFIVINIIISLINLQYGTGEINRIFQLVAEEFLVIILLKRMIPSKEDFYDCIDALIYGSIIMGVIGILQTTANIDVASVLNITADRVGGSIEDRMNMTRAYGTMNAISYGCYCTFMLPIILFRYEMTKKIKYIVSAVIVLGALLCSLTRSAMLVLGVVLLCMLVIRNKKFIKPYLKFLPLVLIGIVLVFIIYPKIWNIITEIAKSYLSSLGVKVDLSDEFGSNGTNAYYSRNVQWSAIYRMIQEHKGAFGYGYNAFSRGELYYKFRQFTDWTKATALDVGFVGIAADSGLVGLASYIALLGSIFVQAVRRVKRATYDFNFLTVFMVILCVVMNVGTSFANASLVWIYFALFYVYNSLEEKEKKGKLHAECYDGCDSQTMYTGV